MLPFFFFFFFLWAVRHATSVVRYDLVVPYCTKLVVLVYKFFGLITFPPSQLPLIYTLSLQTTICHTQPP